MNNEQIWYLTKTHAKFALWMVLMMQNAFGGVKVIEEKFLPLSDFCVITSCDRHAMDVNDHDLFTKALPICCILRSGNDVVALDCGLLRFNELCSQRYIDGKGSVPTDRLKQYYNERNAQWEDLPKKRQVLYSLMLEERNAVVTFIGNARRSVFFNTPNNTEQLKEDTEGWIEATVSDESGNRRDKYWYSPVLKHRFRSTKEVSAFKECLSTCKGNEVLAHAMFCNKRNVEREDRAKQLTNRGASEKKRGKGQKNKKNNKKRKHKK